jgi:ATP-dependent Clp protease ATP-binding subunit ClpA
VRPSALRQRRTRTSPYTPARQKGSWNANTLRFVVDQAYRIAAEAGAPYVGTEHLVVAMLWDDSFIGAHELRRLGVSHAQAAEQLAALPHRERAERIDPLEMVEVPTPAAARLDELARQQAEQTRSRATVASAPCTTCWR